MLVKNALKVKKKILNVKFFKERKIRNILINSKHEIFLKKGKLERV